jgi:hypothetical protein
MELIKEIYKLCSDDANIFSKNLKSLRPVQLKEVRDILSEIEKSKNNQLITLFTAT